MARGSKAWFNGRIMDVQSIHLSIFTHALHYGTGAFEGVRAYAQAQGGCAIFKLKEHIDRWFQSCDILGFQVPYSAEEFTQAAIEVVRENGFQACYLRPLSFISDGPLGVSPGENPPVDFAILAWEWGKYLGDEGAQRGVRLKISSFRRTGMNPRVSEAKATGPYLTGVLAKREAIQAGYDEALLLDSEGFLAEGTGENIFIVKNGVVRTTPKRSILPGITRATIMELLRMEQVRVEESFFTPDDLWNADECFLTGTAAEVTPVREVDGRKIGSSCPGPITEKLQALYQRIVSGEEPPFRKWLTMVSAP